MKKSQNGFSVLELLLILVMIGLIAGVSLYVIRTKNNATHTYDSISHNSSESKSNVLFDHVVIIVEENKGYKTIMEGSEAPFFHELASTYSQANNYYALFHPSLPNYLAMIGGTNGGIEQNCIPGSGCEIHGKNIVDEIEESNRTWKGYMESMPTPCSPQNSGQYAVRHNPFVYYRTFTDDKERCKQHNAPLDQLYKDIEANQLPNFSFITPNLCNDMHDCSVNTGDKWLADVVPKLLESSTFKTKKSLLVITWDEAEPSDQVNQIPTILIGPTVKKAYKSSTIYNHYSLLRTIEDAWDLPALTQNDKTATHMNEFFVSAD
jgi:phospholipase C